MPKTKKIESIVPTEEVKEEAVEESVAEDIAIVDENETAETPAEETTTEKNENTETKVIEESLSDALNKLASAVTDSIEKKAGKKVESAKKPFKLGLFGYLGLVVIVKGAVEIAKAVAESKRPRR